MIPHVDLTHVVRIHEDLSLWCLKSKKPTMDMEGGINGGALLSSGLLPLVESTLSQFPLGAIHI